MTAFTELTETARRLLNMEVNTIIAAAMTAKPMPAVPHALLDIAGWYADALARMGVDLHPYFASDATVPESIALTWVSASVPARSGTSLTVSTKSHGEHQDLRSAALGGEPGQKRSGGSPPHSAA